MFGIVTIIVTVIGSFFLFGLDTEFNKAMDYQNSATIQTLSTEQYENIQDVNNLETDKIKQTKITSNESNTEFSNVSKNKPNNTTYQKTDLKSSYFKDSEKLDKKIKEFEKKIFTLKGTGTYYQGAAHNSKFSSINLTLKPIPNTNLSSFEIISGLMDLGIEFTANKGQVVIKDDKIMITMNRDDHHDVSGTISGSFLGSILDDGKKEHNVFFENQEISIGDKIHSPLYLTINAILSF